MEDKLLKWANRFLICMIFLMIAGKFLFGFTIVQGMSMDPTIKNNDRLFVNKIVYIFKKPRLGDIVIFHPPIKERQKEMFIKRIVAIEGDVFLIEGGMVYVNGQLIHESYINEEKQGENRIYPITAGKVPKGMVFVMGDNRNNSNDSRIFGCVPLKSIEGKAQTRIWPLDTIETFSVHYSGEN